MEKEELILKYKNLRDELGHSPSAIEFYKKAGIHKRKLDNVFGSNSYSKLVKECGDKPKTFFIEKSSFEEILIKYGELTRLLNKLPTQADWSFAKLSPTVSGIEKSHKIKWSELSYKFLEFASGKEEWKDIVVLLPNRSNEHQKSKRNENIDIETDIEQVKMIKF